MAVPVAHHILGVVNPGRAPDDGTAIFHWLEGEPEARRQVIPVDEAFAAGAGLTGWLEIYGQEFGLAEVTVVEIEAHIDVEGEALAYRDGIVDEEP